jgi:hypothetical protein
LLVKKESEVKNMTERITKSIEEMSMAELWSVAKLLGISKEGKRDELIARIKEAQEIEGKNSDEADKKQPKANKNTEAKEAVYISRYYELKLVMTPSYLKEVGGKVLIVRGTSIQFHDGVYKTIKSDEIEFLDNHPNFGSVFRKVETADLKGGKTVDQIYQDKFQTLEQREKELAAREAALRKKEVELKGNEEGASAQQAVTGVRSTAEQPKF